MLKIEKTVLPSHEQWDAIIRGMRNPLNSWDRSDSKYKAKCPVFPDVEYCLPDCHYDQCMHPDPEFFLGENDHQLMMKLAKGGAVHAKYRRMITVMCDITAPLYWWKEFDTYKVGTVANSCSTMHKIHAKEFTLDDFSLEHCEMLTKDVFIQHIIPVLNIYRKLFCGIESGDRKGQKSDWWQMIQLLPTSYNQKRTVMLNYEVLVAMYRDRKNHKLDEWHTLCDWIRGLPYPELIIGGDDNG